MFTMVAQNTRKAFSAVAAVAIVSVGGLVMDQGHLAAAPKGTIAIGELTALGNTTATLAQLPEVVVVAKRESATYFAATQLPEIVVVAKRVATLAAQDDDARRASSPAIQAGF
jgi:hypothetical protein